MLITCCLLAADGVLQISGKRKLTSGKMEDKENGKTPAQLKDELSGLKMRALHQQWNLFKQTACRHAFRCSF